MGYSRHLGAASRIVAGVVLLAACEGREELASAPEGARLRVPPSQVIGAAISLPGDAAPISTAPARSLAAASTQDTTRSGDSTFTSVTFEGYGNRNDISNRSIYGARFVGWRTLEDAEAGGTGNFANEPTASTVAFWVCEEGPDNRLCTNDFERKITFRAPVARVSFSYSARAAQTLIPGCTPDRTKPSDTSCITNLYDEVVMEAWDTIVTPAGVQHVLVDSEPRPINNPTSWPAGEIPGDASDRGDYRVWDPIEVSADDNRIDYVILKGYANFLGIDNYRAVQVNHEPVALITGPSEGYEGVPVNFSGSTSFDRVLADGERHPSRDPVVEYEWDFGDETEPISASSTAPIPHTYANSGEYTVTLSVRDPNGAWSALVASKTVVILNQAPEVSVGSPNPLALPDGQLSFTRSGSFTDLGVEAGWTATVSYGDGPAEPLALEPDKSFTLSHTYGGAGAFPVLVTVSDGEETGSATLTVTVANTAPAISLAAPPEVDEGSTWTVTGSFVDPGPDTWTATVDYGTGAGPQPLPLLPNKSFSLANVYAQDGEYDVVVRIADGTATTRKTVTATVRNVEPVVALAAAGPVNVGLPVTLAASFTDPGADADWEYTIDWGDGAEEGDVLGTAGPIAASHVYEEAGEYTVVLTVEDDDGHDTATILVEVLTPDGAPTLSVAATPGELWPPNHKYHQIRLQVVAGDDVTPAASVQLSATVVSSEPDDARGGGDGNTVGDIQVTRPYLPKSSRVVRSSNASPTVTFDPRRDVLELRAERAGPATGRVYTITVTAADASGNETTQTTLVTVPHDQGGGNGKKAKK